MSSAEQAIERIEAAGGAVVLEGDRIRCRLPGEARELAEELRAHKDEALLVLKQRALIPPIPKGVRLIRWEPKPAPVILTRYEVVVEVKRFVEMTLVELKEALAGKRWLAGNWSIRELTDRLEQCGVVVEVAPKLKD